jgi:uncharacterized protein YycO
MFFGLIYLPYKRKVTVDELSKIVGCQNCIILTLRKYCLTNLFIKGKYKHAAILNKNQSCVVESTTHGVRVTGIKEFLSTKHEYLIIKPSNYLASEMNQVESEMVKYIGHPYDWLFDMNSNNLYCSELVQLVFNKVRHGLFKHIGKIIEPSELLDADIEVVYEFSL